MLKDKYTTFYLLQLGAFSSVIVISLKKIKIHAGIQSISQAINNAANPGFPFNKQTGHIRTLLEEREIYYLLMAPYLSNYCLVIE